MSKSEEDSGWGEFGDDGEEDVGALIPKGREMTVEEEWQFLAALLAGSLNADTIRISESRMG